ncbi:MAG TPA: nucleoside deaminase [Gammaproteobacteria bacterium]|nr:nucleoside deaminase [Gammaproteobacteria bacterium]
MHERYMREAIELAREAVTADRGGPFGAVVVQGDRVVGRGCNRVTSDNDPTAHAEVSAIRDACARLGRYWLEDCVLYVNCEPCPMCLGAIYWARIGKVYYAGVAADAAAAGFADQQIAEELCRPADARRLPMEQLLRDEALPVFQLWRDKPDRLDY